MPVNDPFPARDPLRAARSRLLQRISAPSAEPVTLEEAKQYLRIEHDNEDALIEDLVTAARMMAEQWLRRSIITQSWLLSYDYGIPEGVWLPMGPVQAVANVESINDEDISQPISSSTYRLNAAKDTLLLDAMITGTRVAITYSAGYGDAEDVPLPILQGILSHVAFLYENRGEMLGAALPGSVASLYLPFREVRL